MRKRLGLIALSVGIILSLSVINSGAIGELTSYFKNRFNGLNTKVNPRLLNDDDSPSCSNITLDEAGSVSDRDLFGQYNSSSGALGSNAVTGLFKFYTTTNKYFIATAGDKQASGTGGAWTDISTTYNTVSGTFWTGATFNDKFYMANESVPLQQWSGMGNLSAIQYPDSNCRYLAVHKNRLWAASSTTIPYRTYFSSLDNADDWVSTGGYVDLPDSTAIITGIVTWGGRLWIFTETDIYGLSGSTPNDFSLTRSNSSVGTISPRSIRITDIGIVFLGRGGVYAFNGNTSPRISDDIEPTINAISPTKITSAVGEYDGKKYWLAYTSRDNTYNNKILIYDTILKSWYPYDDLNINYFAFAYGGADRGEVYGGSSTPDGIVWRLTSSVGTEVIVHDTESDFLTGVTHNTIVRETPLVEIRDGNDDYTSLLVHFDGVNGATTYTTEDYGARVVTFNANAEINTSRFVRGISSLYCDGTGDYAQVPDSDAFTFGSGDFTVDFWVNFTATANEQNFVGQYTNGDNQWYARKQADGKLRIAFRVATNDFGDWQTASAPTFVANTWYHIAFVREGSTPYIFIDGVSQSVQKNFDLDDIKDISQPLRIGSNGEATNMLNGYMDEVRISKGIARWTSNFNPQSTNYTDYLSNGTLTSGTLQINASGGSALGTIVWQENLPSTHGDVTMQTRTGATNDTVYFNGWQAWTSSSTVHFDVVTDGSVTFTSSDATNFAVAKPFTAQLRNVLYYEDEDNASPNCVQITTTGAPSKNDYATGFVPSKNLTDKDWLVGWAKSPSTGNSVVFSMGEYGSVEWGTTINTVMPDVWEKWYWYIGDIPNASKDAIRYTRVQYLGDTAGNLYVGESEANNYYTSGDTMTSSANDWLQYRAIFGTNVSDSSAQLIGCTLTYTPASGTPEGSLSSYYYTKPLDFQSPQKSKQFEDLTLTLYQENDVTYNTVEYVDYDIDYGTKTGTLSFSIAVTENTVVKRRYFPGATFGKVMQLKFYNSDKDAKITVRSCEVRFRQEPFQ